MASRKYGTTAGKIDRAPRAMKRSKLQSGTETKVTSRKQAGAIGLAETRSTGSRPSKTR